MKSNLRLLVLFLLIAVGTISCSKEKTENSTPDQPFSNSASIVENHEIAIYGPGIITAATDSMAVTFYVANLSSTLSLQESYVLDGMLYVDNGQYFDQVANDGVYTSVKTIHSSNIVESDYHYNGFSELPVFYDPDVLSFADVDKPSLVTEVYGSTMYDPTVESDRNEVEGSSVSVKVGCKLRWVECDNQHWWSTSLNGEKCIEWYDCDFSIEFTWDF